MSAPYDWSRTNRDRHIGLLPRRSPGERRNLGDNENAAKLVLLKLWCDTYLIEIRGNSVSFDLHFFLFFPNDLAQPHRHALPETMV